METMNYIDLIWGKGIWNCQGNLHWADDIWTSISGKKELAILAPGSGVVPVEETVRARVQRWGLHGVFEKGKEGKCEWHLCIMTEIHLWDTCSNKNVT